MRLIDEFVSTKPTSHHLHLVLTARTPERAQNTISRLQKHVRGSLTVSSRISLHPELVDLTCLLSVRFLASKLLRTLPRLDAIILNAGTGGFTGLYWSSATWNVLTDVVYALTWPSYKKAGVGYLTKRQTDQNSPSPEADARIRGSFPATGANPRARRSEPPLGQIFCANVFGHYLLSHQLSPLLSASRNDLERTGRIIWISSIEAYESAFSVGDIQGLKSRMAYESSKRLTDLLALTASLPSTTPWTTAYRNSTAAPQPGSAPRIKIYVAHPGICATSIVPLSIIVSYTMIIAFYLARWLGSPWHTIRPYSGACAPVWLALSPQSQLDSLELENGPGKWGSATDLWGRDRVMRTEVEGWGFGGQVGKTIEQRKGRRRGVPDLTAEARQSFEELGRDCWKEIEALREEWGLLLDHNVDNNMTS